MQTMFLTLVAVCLPLGVVMVASVAAAVLAPLELPGGRTALRSRRSTCQTPIFEPPSGFGIG